MGHQAQLALEPLDGSFDTSSEPYEFVSENLKKTGEILDTNGIRATRSHAKERTRPGKYGVNGTIVLHPSPADLDALLPRIMGTAESADSFVFAEGLDDFRFGVMIDRVGKVFTYNGCIVNKATFRGSAGGLVELALDLIGKTEAVGAAGSFPALTLGTDDNDAPYVFHEGVMTLVSSSRTIMDFEIVIDNALRVRFANSQTATDISPGDRIVTVKCTTPYTSDETDLYGQATEGSAATFVLTNGNMSTTFTLATVQFPDNSPVVGSKDEVTLTLEGIARKSGTTEELVVTHDSDSVS